MRPLSDVVFSIERSSGRSAGSKLVRQTAAKLGLREDWLQRAIAENPDLVIGPCRAAEITSDDWYISEREYPTEAGPIDVLLVSDGGRLAIVETKLSFNPDNRRKVLAQVLDYAVHLREALMRRPPELPMAGDRPIVTQEEVRARLSDDDPLLIIAGDNLDERIERLAKAMLAGQTTRGWELALVDVALFTNADASDSQVLAIPHLRGVIQPDFRASVRVIVEGEVRGHRIEAVVEPPAKDFQSRERWNAERFFAELDASALPAPYKRLARDVMALPDRWPSLDVAWGTGQTGSLTLKRRGAGIVELYGSGIVGFRRDKLEPALGPQAVQIYREDLGRLFPRVLDSPHSRVPSSEASPKAAALGELISRVVEMAEKNRT